MTGPELLADLDARGVHLTARGDRLEYDAPAGAMTPELMAQLKTNKGELLAILAAKTPEPPWEPVWDERYGRFVLSPPATKTSPSGKTLYPAPGGNWETFRQRAERLQAKKAAARG